MPRNWRDMREKVRYEEQCRVCGSTEALEAAHIIARAVTRNPIAEDALNCMPLCTVCHRLFDARKLDILPYMTVPEQGHAVLVAGGVITMLRRVTGSRWEPERRAA